ncbi:MAG: type IV pilus assembly protein PilM [Bythopirellula sp.]|nr:type IV pilus assembly protein PilM [Bythopirellula sp.]
MAKSNAVWGIDIGQCALKALLCRPHEKEADRIVVESFDYIEYPKILSQPEADPEELVREALTQFLSRNEIIGDRVAISVAGQSGLARFIKLPPVEAKKIPDIVKYEARQQIPFSLDDVVWDYQQLTGGSEEDGFALEPEVGLFAMKRDQVARALKPLEAAGIEVDFIQLMPLAVYNFVCFDRLGDFKSQPFDPKKPPLSTVVISLGTDTTDLVVTNGFRVWQRNIPIGGNHFTRSLSKELKLTFVKAEHLKRNATEADDPKAVFQAMRPVFSDLLSEIQRSLGYFTSIDKSAKIGNVLALGNGMKLPGLQRYLSQNLEFEVTPVTEFERLSAGSAAGKPQFKENTLSFAVAYGLCLQGLGRSELKTNLLPEEIVRTRLVRGKKPWMVAGAAAILAGLTFNYYSHVAAWSEAENQAMKDAETRAKSVQTTASGFESQSSEIHTAFDAITATGEKLVSNIEGRLRWLELMKALDAALPRDERPAEERKETAKDISGRNELHILAMETQHFTDLGTEWLSVVQSAYDDAKGKSAADAAVDPLAAAPLDAAPVDVAADPAAIDPAATADATGGALTGPGWVVQLTGFHYHNADSTNERGEFVKNTLIKNLEEGIVSLPDGPEGALMDVPIKDLAISHAWLVKDQKLTEELIDPEAMMQDPSASTGGGGYGRGGEGAYRGAGATGVAGANDKMIKLNRYDFIVQFVWQPKTRAQRAELATARAEAEKAAAEAKAAADAAAAEQPEAVEQ